VFAVPCTVLGSNSSFVIVSPCRDPTADAAHDCFICCGAREHHPHPTTRSDQRSQEQQQDQEHVHSDVVVDTLSVRLSGYYVMLGGDVALEFTRYRTIFS
jgi:hypothetical protein